MYAPDEPAPRNLLIGNVPSRGSSRCKASMRTANPRSIPSPEKRSAGLPYYSFAMGAAHHGPGLLILKAGLVAGVLDGFDAIAFAGWYRGVPVARIFQFIASGAVGTKAFQLGWVGVALGIFFHFTIAIGAAAVFYLVTRRWMWPLKAPLIAGPIYGIGVFLFMRYVVVALSAIPPQPPSKMAGLVNLVFSHIFFVGIPIALVISQAAKAQTHTLRRAA